MSEIPGPIAIGTIKKINGNLITIDDPDRGEVVVQIPYRTWWPCGCLWNDAGAHRVHCPVYPEGVRGDV